MKLLRASLLALLVATSLIALTSAPATADCTWVENSYFTNGMLLTETEMQCSGSPPVSGEVETQGSIDPPVGSALCEATATWLNESADQFCLTGDTPSAVTPALAARALRRVPLPPSTLQVQPPNGRTLVNFATNFYTDREELTRVVTLLGQRVELRITPSSFTWHFDDGDSATTASPGAPYPRLEITHDYLRKGGVSPRVDTTYTAVFRVGGGAWQPVPGSVTIPGAPVALDVVEASPILVGYE